MKRMEDGTFRFRNRWTHRGYWGITGALHLVLRAGGAFLLICLGLLGAFGVFVLVVVTGGTFAILLGAAAIIWAVGWIIGVVSGIVRARRSRPSADEDDNVVPIEHAPRRRFHR